VTSLITGATSPWERQKAQDSFAAATIKCSVPTYSRPARHRPERPSHGYFLELGGCPAQMSGGKSSSRLQKEEAVTFDVATWPGSVTDKVQQFLVRRHEGTSCDANWLEEDVIRKQRRDYMRRWRRENPALARSKGQSQKSAAIKTQARNTQLRVKFGITREQYEACALLSTIGVPSVRRAELGAERLARRP